MSLDVYDSDWSINLYGVGPDGLSKVLKCEAKMDVGEVHLTLGEENITLSSFELFDVVNNMVLSQVHSMKQQMRLKGQPSEQELPHHSSYKSNPYL